MIHRIQIAIEVCTIHIYTHMYKARKRQIHTPFARSLSAVRQFGSHAPFSLSPSVGQPTSRYITLSYYARCHIKLSSSHLQARNAQ